MINLEPFTGKPVEFLEEIIKSRRNSKADPEFKDRLNILFPSVVSLLGNFNDKHNSNCLHNLVSKGYQGIDKNDLIKLYSYKSKVITKLKFDITTIAKNRIINTCQNCTINEIGSFDHIVPKNEFPEFSVHPYNLFPSCLTCNEHKSTTWRENDKSVFLNLYLDKLPVEQYLFVTVWFEDQVIKTKFTLENINNIDSEFFLLIESHYKRLKLLERFSNNSHDVIVELKNEIDRYKDKIKLEEIKNIILEGFLTDKKSFGYNYWKTALKQALINNNGFTYGNY